MDTPNSYQLEEKKLRMHENLNHISNNAQINANNHNNNNNKMNNSSNANNAVASVVKPVVNIFK